MKKVDLYSIQTEDSLSNPLLYSNEVVQPVIHAIQKEQTIQDDQGNDIALEPKSAFFKLTDFTAEEQAKIMEVAAILKAKFVNE